MSGPAPLAHLVAEAAAFPLTAPVAWRARVLRLTRVTPGADPDGAAAALTQPLAAHLRVRARGMNEELLRHVRDRAWFPAHARDVSITAHVVNLADRYLALNGGDVELRNDVERAPWDDGGVHDMSSRAMRWRWLSLALPPELLVAACAASAGYDDPPGEHVRLATPSLEKVLERGCAETHMHVSAAVPYSRLWTAWMLAPPPAQALPRDAPFGGDRELEAMLAGASVARLAMAWFLLDGRSARDLQAFLGAPIEDFIRDHAWHHAPRRLRDVVVGACGRVIGHPIGHNAASFRWLIARVNPDRKPTNPPDLSAREPLARWLPAAPSIGLPEGRLCTLALRHLLRHERTDPLFAELFWQYQRVRCQMYRYLVEEPGTAGLDWFTRFQKRISPLRKPLNSTRYQQALRVQSQGLHLAAMEARTSPSSRWFEVRDEARAVAREAIAHQRDELASAQEAPEVGLILHFIKDRTSTLARRGVARPNADPAHAPMGMRFSHWFRGRQREAQAIATALRHHPELLVVLRGIDVANLEMSTPTWVLAPLFAQVREAAARAARRLAVRSPRWRVPGLRVTVHAGEDYRRLMEGLRRMIECVEAGLLRTGDRIGHGLAVGVDVARYAAEHPLVLQPAEERLDDLLWEFERHQSGDGAYAPSRSEYLRAQITQLGEEVYGPPAPSVEHLALARRMRFSPAALEGVGYPKGGRVEVPSMRDGPRWLFYRYLTDDCVYARGQLQVEVRVTEAEQRALVEAQGYAQRALAKLEVTLECNPTSNLLIGDIGALDAHPAFRLMPIDQATPRYGVPISINTDNPVTFGSCLGDEFAALYHALLSLGVGAAQAVAWIDAARDAGMRSRFSLAVTKDPQVLAALI